MDGHCSTSCISLFKAASHTSRSKFMSNNEQPMSWLCSDTLNPQYDRYLEELLIGRKNHRMKHKIQRDIRISTTDFPLSQFGKKRKSMFCIGYYGLQTIKIGTRSTLYLVNYNLKLNVTMGA